MGIFPVEFPTTTADGFESLRLLHYLAFIKGGFFIGMRTTEKIQGCKLHALNFIWKVLFSSNLNF